MIKTIVVAAFKVTEDKSVAYRKYVTVEGATNGINYIIHTYEPDYISVRVIKDDT